MLYLKTCPKCRGDMYLDKDSYGFFRQCLQCGLIQDLVEKTAAPKQLPTPQPAPAAARTGPRRIAIA